MSQEKCYLRGLQERLQMEGVRRNYIHHQTYLFPENQKEYNLYQQASARDYELKSSRLNQRQFNYDESGESGELRSIKLYH